MKFVQVVHSNALLAEAALDAVEVQLQRALMGLAQPRLVDGRVVRHITARDNAASDICQIGKGAPVSRTTSLGSEGKTPHIYHSLDELAISSRDDEPNKRCA